MSEEWTPCRACRHYDPDKRWCNLFRRHIRDGCPYGEDQDDATE